MSYTQNESIDGLTAITPTTDDLVVTMDQAEVGVAKTSTLASIYNLFKTTYDTVYESLANKSTSVTTDQASNTKYPSVKSVYDWATVTFAKYLGDADFYQYSIVTSVASGNLTVALKNYEGNDPTSTKPIKIQIGGVVRTITSALSDTFPAGTNWRNAGSSELATKEVDYFCYVGIDNLNNIRFGVSRVANGTNQNDFSASGSYTNERYLMDYGISFNVVNIGRFNATLSAGAGYTWSIPATSVIINSPIYETRWLNCNSTISNGGSMTITNVVINHFRYKIVGDNLFYKNNIKMDFGGTTNNYIFETLPFGRILSDSYDISGVGFGYDNADLAPSVIFENTETNKLRIIKLTSVYAVVNDANIRVQGNYQI